MAYAPTFGDKSTLIEQTTSSTSGMKSHGNEFHTSTFITLDGIPKATDAIYGKVKVDGTSISSTDGVISVIGGTSIASPGPTIDREILIWDGITGNAIITPSNAYITALGTVAAGADVIAYQTEAPAASFWDTMPAATSTTMGGFILDNTQMEMNAGVLSIIDGILTPGDHEHSWQDITSGSQPAPIAHQLDSATYHTVSGLTIGHFLRATASDSFGFGALTGDDVKAVIEDWFKLEGSAPNQYIRCLFPFASDGEIQAFTDSGQLPPNIWEAMPVASPTVLGSVKVGTNLSIDGNGVLSATGGVANYPGAGIVVSTGPGGWGTSITNNSVNWNTAYSHTSLTNNPHVVTASQVGLGNVTNESKVTMFSSPTFTGNVYFPGSGIWNSSGNVGLGGSPSYQLHQKSGGDTWHGIESNLYFAGTIYVKNGTQKWMVGLERDTPFYGGGANDYVFYDATLGTLSGKFVTGASSSSMKFQVNGGIFSNNSAATNCFILNSAGANYGFISNSAANEWFLGYGTTINTLGTSVLKWNSSGQVGIGASPASYPLQVGGVINRVKISNGSVGSPAAEAAYYYGVNGSGYSGIDFLNTFNSNLGCWMQFVTNNGSTSTVKMTLTGTGNLNVTGEVTAYYSSDRFLKQNIRPFSALEKIERMNPIAFNWNAKAKELNSLKDDRINYGVVAQDLEQVMPELVHGIYDNKYKSVDYVQLVPVLIQAVKELKQEINTLRNGKGN